MQIDNNNNNRCSYNKQIQQCCTYVCCCCYHIFTHIIWPHTIPYSHMLLQHVAKQCNVAVVAAAVLLLSLPIHIQSTNYIVSAHSAHTHRHIVAQTHRQTVTHTRGRARKYKIYTKWLCSTIETKKTQSLLKVCQHAAHACNKSLYLSLFLTISILI